MYCLFNSAMPDTRLKHNIFVFLLTEPSIVVPTKIPGQDDDPEDGEEPDILAAPRNTRTGQPNENLYEKKPKLEHST